MRRMLAAFVVTVALAGVSVAQGRGGGMGHGGMGGGMGHGGMGGGHGSGHHHHGHIHWFGPWGWYNPFYTYGGYDYGYSPYADAAANVSASRLMEAESQLMAAQADRQRLLRRQREISNQVDEQKAAAGRAWAAAKKSEPQKRPNRFNDADWNKITGAIAWPATFESADFDSSRSSVDELFRRVAERGGGQFTSAERADLRMMADRLQAKLAPLAREMPASRYISALRFIDGVRDAATYSS